MVHHLTSWCDAALRGFSKLSNVTCTPSFWNRFSPAWSALKVDISCFVHALCNSFSGWPGRAGRFPIRVSILTPLSFKNVSIFRRCTATSSGDCWYFINFANLWKNNVRSCEMISVKFAQNLWKFPEGNRVHDFRKQLMAVSQNWRKVVNKYFSMLISYRRMILKKSSPRIWSRQTVEQYIAIDNYCSGWLLHSSFDQIR